MRQDILVIGDSWSSAIESDTGLDRGWPHCLGVEKSLQQGISGSRANQWAGDYNGRLTKATGSSAKIVILSLLGNDLFEAISDGEVTWREKLAVFQNMKKVLRAINDFRERVIVLQYANPMISRGHPRYEMAQTAVPLLNAGIALCCDGEENVETVDLGEWMSYDRADGHFDGKDIHPTAKGHTVIAEKMASIL